MSRGHPWLYVSVSRSHERAGSVLGDEDVGEAGEGFVGGFDGEAFTLARIYNPSLSNIRIYNPQTYHTLFIMNYLMRISNPYIYMCRI